MRVFIIILWLILGVIYFWIWDNGINTCCDDNSTPKKETTVVNTKPDNTKTNLKSALPLAFNWDVEKTVVGDRFKEYKDSILATLKDGQILEITGFYRENEKNTTSFDNLGLARAHEIRKLFAELPDERFRFFGKKVNEKEGDKSNVFMSASFKSAANNSNIKEIANVASIYFPFNSTRKLDNSKIETYLDDVAERVIKSGEIVILTGHTDDIGSNESNFVLGKRRAEILKNYLLSKGVSSNQINIFSKGENSPIVPNNSTENRAKNRRVELKINKP